MTHFATSDDDPDFAREQLAAFLPFVAELRRRRRSPTRPTPPATLGIPESRLGMVRCGIAAYGLDPFQCDPADHGLAPAMTLASYVAEVKPIAPGRVGRLRAPLRRRGRDGDRDGADRLRRRRPPRAEQQRRRC